MQIPCWRFRKNEEPFMCSDIIFVFPAVWKEVCERGMGTENKVCMPRKGQE